MGGKYLENFVSDVHIKHESRQLGSLSSPKGCDVVVKENQVHFNAYTVFWILTLSPYTYMAKSFIRWPVGENFTTVLCVTL